MAWRRPRNGWRASRPRRHDRPRSRRRRKAGSGCRARPPARRRRDSRGRSARAPPDPVPAAPRWPRARAWVSTRQARLCAPAAEDSSCQVMSSFWRTTRPLGASRPWQVEPPQEATPSCVPMSLASAQGAARQSAQPSRAAPQNGRNPSSLAAPTTVFPHPSGRKIPKTAACAHFPPLPVRIQIRVVRGKGGLESEDGLPPEAARCRAVCLR